MNSLPKTLIEKLKNLLSSWILVAILLIGLVVIFASYAKDTLAAGTAQAPAPTATAMPDMNNMPGMVMPTLTPVTSQPVYAQPATNTDLDGLLTQMQTMTQSLQGMMGQLDQKSTGAPVTALPASGTVDLQPYMTELQDINRSLMPLMTRIQADLQGNPSPEELASVRAQVAEIQGRIARLLSQLQAARGITPAQPAIVYNQTQMQTTTAMNQLDASMQHLQGMINQTQSQQQSGMAVPSGQMDSMMAMMDNMMMMMDNMMGQMDMMMSMDSMNNSGSNSGGGMPGMDMMGMPDM